MNSTPSYANAASTVAQSKKDRIPGLGRGPGLINNLRSPNTLKIAQVNINGISTRATRIKFGQVLGLALIEGAQIIALQETKLKANTFLKIKGYNIFRLDRQNRSGGGLTFLIKNINYQCININRKITDGSNLEIQGIRIIWRGMPLNIFNMYHSPLLRKFNSLVLQDEQAAELLGLPYQKISRLNFAVKDRNVKIRASRIVHGCRSDIQRGTSIFNRDFRVNELEAVISDTTLNKSPGPDSIHGRMIDHFGLSGRQRFLNIINCSWNKGQLPRDWRATIISTKKFGKTDGTSDSYRPIALYNQYCF
ncbi:hypothetical protein TNCV_155521 [Trichonephila clavipes]|uniref:Uncharacterized protein n=1 Tax=Trichonephila clavipes TaxID=2585209 RepID=A0A8X6WHP7_TRICX|nr:hypothetical protein TNCV_155521 [Trichonephila clavipes]